MLCNCNVTRRQTKLRWYCFRRFQTSGDRKSKRRVTGMTHPIPIGKAESPYPQNRLFGSGSSKPSTSPKFKVCHIIPSYVLASPNFVSNYRWNELKLNCLPVVGEIQVSTVSFTPYLKRFHLIRHLPKNLQRIPVGPWGLMSIPIQY